MPIARTAAMTGSLIMATAALLTAQALDSRAETVKARNGLQAANLNANQNWAPLEEGQASWYGPAFHGKKTASGEIYDQSQMTAAHPSLPFGSMVRVTNLENNRSVILRINDRGPFKPGRVIDVSYRGAQQLAMIGRGLTQVKVETTRDAALNTSARQPLVADQLRNASHPCGPYAPATHSPAPALDPNSPFPDRQQAAAQRLGQVFVQIGAYEQQNNARLVDANLRELAPSRIEPIRHYDGRMLYRVRLGPFDTVSRADQVRDMADDAGFPDSKVVLD